MLINSRYLNTPCLTRFSYRHHDSSIALKYFGRILSPRIHRLNPTQIENPGKHIPCPMLHNVVQYAPVKYEHSDEISLAMRCSATKNDTPRPRPPTRATLNGFISVEGPLLSSHRRCTSSNFTDRSIHYNYDNIFDNSDVDLRVLV